MTEQKQANEGLSTGFLKLYYNKVVPCQPKYSKLKKVDHILLKENWEQGELFIWIRGFI